MKKIILGDDSWLHRPFPPQTLREQYKPHPVVGKTRKRPMKKEEIFFHFPQCSFLWSAVQTVTAEDSTFISEWQLQPANIPPHPKQAWVLSGSVLWKYLLPLSELLSNL